MPAIITWMEPIGSSWFVSEKLAYYLFVHERLEYLVMFARLLQDFFFWWHDVCATNETVALYRLFHREIILWRNYAMYWWTAISEGIGVSQKECEEEIQGIENFSSAWKLIIYQSDHWEIIAESALFITHIGSAPIISRNATVLEHRCRDRRSTFTALKRQVKKFEKCSKLTALWIREERKNQSARQSRGSWAYLWYPQYPQVWTTSRWLDPLSLL